MTSTMTMMLAPEAPMKAQPCVQSLDTCRRATALLLTGLDYEL